MQVCLISVARHDDERGWFAETFSARRLADAGIMDSFVQDNQSYSRRAGTLRGLHFQVPPFAQAKLVRCLRGAIWDVVVDIRVGSPTYGQSIATELSESDRSCLYVPLGFAHGFITLTDDCEVEYKVSAIYSPGHESGIAWNDPALALAWPLSGRAPIMSEKDRQLPRFQQLLSPFAFEGVPLSLVGLA